MEKNKEFLNKLEKQFKKSNLNRREALKVLTIGSTFLLNNELYAKEENKSTAKVDILIIGAGLAGISSAARLSNSLENAKITIIEPNTKSCSYQAGNTLIASGIYTEKDISYHTQNFVPKNTSLLVDKAIEFDPFNNKVLTKKGHTIKYDFLIISAGLVLDFTKIKGLEELQNLYSLQKNNYIKKYFKDTGISTIYNSQAAKYTWLNMQELIKEAKTGRRMNAIFTHPRGPIKNEAAPKEIIYLMNARLREARVKENVNMNFYTSLNKLFQIDSYEKKTLKLFNEKNINYKLSHELKEIDLKNKLAIFDNSWKEKTHFNEDVEEFETIIKHQRVEVPYHFLHLTPPMKAAPEIANSALASKEGWIPANKATLQHKKYQNVFALGDIIDAPLGKTGGSIRKQYKVLCNNLISLIEGKELLSNYDGYTVYPISTDIGKVILSEFNWSMKAKATFPLDPYEERYLWWLVKLYLLKPFIMHGMLSGKA